MLQQPYQHIWKIQFTVHLIASGHSYDRSTLVQLLHEEENEKECNALEVIQITEAKSNTNLNIVNEQIPISTLVNVIYAQIRTENNYYLFIHFFFLSSFTILQA